MRPVLLTAPNGARVLCSCPEHVRELLDLGAELVNAADLEVIARESAKDPVVPTGEGD